MKKAKWMAMVVAMVMVATMSVAAPRHDSAVLLVDVSGTVGEEGELNGAIELLRDMNSRFPDYVQSGGIMTFGNQTRPQLNWVLPTADYNESSLDGSLSGLGAGNGPTPIGAALRAVAPGVESAKGKKR